MVAFDLLNYEGSECRINVTGKEIMMTWDLVVCVDCLVDLWWLRRRRAATIRPRRGYHHINAKRCDYYALAKCSLKCRVAHNPILGGVRGRHSLLETVKTLRLSQQRKGDMRRR